MLSAVITKRVTSLIAFQFELFFCIEFLQTLFFEGRGVGRRETNQEDASYKTPKPAHYS